MPDVIFRNRAGEQRGFEVTHAPEEVEVGIPPNVGWFPVRFATDLGSGRVYPISIANTFEDGDGMTWHELSSLPSQLPGAWRLAGVIATRADRERVETLLSDRAGQGSSRLGEGYLFADDALAPMHYGVWLDANIFNPLERRNAVWRDFREAFLVEFPQQHYGSYIAVN